ncbi:ABC transporter ATP-binding protein [Pseudonocardia sp. CA-107938]|uniref:ABC transporter ATP-binding protein n=1 Tax=Pseudonocardia sp. CA-107938 TaxID=3240021 RepID=UPI003D8B16B0
MTLFRLAGLTGGYGAVPVVHDLDLEIRPGEVVGMVGRNGMGKSTALRTAFGLATRHGGTVTLADAPVPPRRPDLLARRGASLMPEDRGVFPTLTVEENVRLAQVRGYRPAVDPRDVFPLLTQRARQPAGTLSGGQQQLVGLARSVLAGSRLVVVDEVTQGLQPSIVTEVMELVAALAADGVGLLLVDQSPQTLVRACHRVLVMERGRLVLDEPVTPATSARVADLLQLR